ncbi:hypothetical protein HYH03_010114 [Edaphochlamys debaryana]|uniref:Protein kinase domain-containing protein n=1 Tax=Edaphochlamys debaryana TaxID=47281 RepID=A0A835XYU8_9CHLO|nr:hypothetical protein HYH03_010114 [Edaphochlamys debaryana]|eukprot:KAG2491543.1 hypothetical protein HYH03_010114 [Edaphochlamys debaryana]
MVQLGNTPLLISRNLTVRGSPNLPERPVVALRCRHKVKLADHVTVALEDGVYSDLSIGKWQQALRADIFVAADPETVGAFAVVRRSALLVGLCPPQSLVLPYLHDVFSTPGAQASRPGVFDIQSDQPGCVPATRYPNGSVVPPLQRCWAYTIPVVEARANAIEVSAVDGSIREGHYIFGLENTTALCQVAMSEECLARLGLAGCLEVTWQYYMTVATWFDRYMADVDAYVASRTLAGDVPRLPLRPPPAGGGDSAAGLVGSPGDPLLGPAAAAEGAAPDGGHSPNISVPAAVGIGAAAVLACAVAVAAVLWLRRRRQGAAAAARAVSAKATSTAPSVVAIDVDLTPGRGRPPRLPPLAAEASADGGFGRVYAGEMGGQAVAVKLIAEDLGHLHPEDAAHLVRGFEQELEVLARCSHPCIVRVLAACANPPRPCIVMERMETSLERMLHGAPGTLLPLPVVIHIALEVARGLEYLHPTVLHRDLKPGNVLINDPHSPHPVVKISDFGLSRLRQTMLQTMHPEAGTPAYLAPECYDLSAEGITYKTDIYSWGVLVWEALAGYKPWSGMNTVKIAVSIQVHNARLPMPAVGAPGEGIDRWPLKLVRLIAECWDRDPLRRPAAAELVKRLLLIQEVGLGNWLLSLD